LDEPGVISGTVVGPAPLSAATVKLYTSDGRQLTAFVGQDGSFVFRDVPAGSHLLHPHHPSLFYPEIRIDTSTRAGVLRAMMVSQAKSMAVALPLQLRPLGELQYFEKRKPLDVWSFVKSPYGLMIVFSLFIIVVMPRLKVDPEEMRQMQEELRGTRGGAAGGSGASNGNNRVAGSAAPARVTAS